MVGLASPAGCVHLLCFHREVRILQLYLSRHKANLCYGLRLIYLYRDDFVLSNSPPQITLIWIITHGQYVNSTAEAEFFRLPPSV